LKLNNRSFRHASPRLWNELPKDLRQLVDEESLSLSSHLSLTGSSLSSSSSSLSLCITPSLFHSRLKTYLFINHSHHSLPHLFGRISQIFITISGLNCSSVFLLFCSFYLFCLTHVIDNLSAFELHVKSLQKSLNFPFLSFPFLSFCCHLACEYDAI